MISLKKFLAEQLPKLYAKKPDHKILEKVQRYYKERVQVNLAQPMRKQQLEDVVILEDEKKSRPGT